MTIQQWFTFQLANTWLAIEPNSVVTILDPQHYVHLPLTPSHILGIIPHGQSIIPILHLSDFLRMLNSDILNPQTHRVLIVSINDMDVGIPIQVTGGVEIISENQVSNQVLTKNGRLQDFLVGEFEGDHGLSCILDIGMVLERSRV